VSGSDVQVMTPSRPVRPTLLTLRRCAALGCLAAVLALPGSGALAAPRPASFATKVTPVDRTAKAAAVPGSAWDRPALVRPARVVLSSSNRNLQLDPKRDYLLVCPPGIDSLSAGLSIWGGHNVVLDRCDVHITGASGGMALKNQTGTIWMHDLHISGPRLLEGIDLQEPDATVVLRDVLIDTVHGSYATNHADLIQSWAGPRRLLIDGFAGTTDYQGFFLLPNQWDSGPRPRVFDLRNVGIDDTHGAYALWVGDVTGNSIPTWNVENVHVTPNPARVWRGWWLWGFGGQDSDAPGRGTWATVVGAAPAQPFVRARPGGATGIDERASPTRLAGEQL
jgi:hypothetical protein